MILLDYHNKIIEDTLLEKFTSTDTASGKFEAVEISYKLGDIVFADGNKVVSEMSMWFLPDKNKKPIIVELDFDCNAKEIAESNQTSLEEFPPSLIKNLNNLYSSLQRESIVDLAIPRTKTEFAYKPHGLS